MYGDWHSRTKGLVTHFGIEGFGEEIISYYPRGVVVETLEVFLNGMADRIIPFAGSPEERTAAVLRALSRVGEKSYSVLSNNCEHFVSWCSSGLAVSKQVIAGVWALILLGAAWLLSALGSE